MDGNGKSLVEYKPMRVDSKIGTMEIHVELGKETLDEVVVSGIAMLWGGDTSMSVTAAGMPC